MADIEKNKHVEAVEITISTILRVGVLASLAIVIIGMAVSFYHHRDYFTSHEQLTELIRPDRPYAHSITDTLTGVLSGRGQSIIVLGILLLILTPVMRVAVSIIAFIIQKDRKFVVITTIVLILLVLSFFLGRVEGGG